MRSVKAYVIVTSALFAVLLVAHAWRLAAEGLEAAHPAFTVSSILAAGMLVWGGALLRRRP